MGTLGVLICAALLGAALYFVVASFVGIGFGLFLLGVWALLAFGLLLSSGGNPHASAEFRALQDRSMTVFVVYIMLPFMVGGGIGLYGTHKLKRRKATT